MDERDEPPPEEPVLTPVLATVAINDILPLDLLLDAQSKEDCNHIIADGNQETKSSNNQQKLEVSTEIALHEVTTIRQSELLGHQISASLDTVVVEYGGTSGSDLDSTSDLEFSSDDEDCEHATTEDFIRKVINCRISPNKNGIDTCDLGAGDMDTPDAHQSSHTKIASLPLKPTETTFVIFENEYFQVKRSPLAGWGAFAVRELKEGDQILVEKPLFTATNLTLFDGFASLTKPLRDVAYSLHANSNFKEGHPVELLIWKTNAFSTPNPLSGNYDNAGLFPIASRFNHACEPINSVKWHYSDINDILEMTVQAESVQAGQELTISYDALSPVALYDRYGFQCSCGGCQGVSDQELAEREEYQWYI
ncbi:hypothetical protein ACHAPO_000898 [Fusarium lateritium]